MNPDPPRREDGRCHVCRKPIRQVTSAMRKYAGAQIDVDPFCSTQCCRKYHATELPLTAQERRALDELTNDRQLAA